MATNKRKTTTAIVAGVTALALVLGGTFAWTSIQQEARNEAIVDINPGGRLHDDFNGTNKDVYVENFGDTDTGVPIYARIRLDEYMEIGQDAGKNKGGYDRKVTVLDNDGAEGTTPDINDVTTWQTYIPGATDAEHAWDTNETVYTRYWDWGLGHADEGTLPYYLPTFNKNKDSLAADINGTYEGTVAGDIVHYDDYVEYGEGQTVSGTEIYDWDSNTTEELNGQKSDDVTVYSTDDATQPIDYANVYEKSTEVNDAGETVAMAHSTKRISTGSTVILMSEYLNMDETERKTLNAWVYDTDGWAYWSQAIQPGETTGLLLDNIQQVRVPDDNWYYGINVVGQFATAGDLSAFENEGGGMTDGALELLGEIIGNEQALIISGPDTVAAGETATYSATMKRMGVALDEQPTVTYRVEYTPATAALTTEATDGNTVTIDASTGVVSIGAGVPEGSTFTVTATADGYEATKQVTVASDPLPVLVLKTGVATQMIPYTPGTAVSYKIQLEVGAEDEPPADLSSFYMQYALDSEYENELSTEYYSFDADTDTLTITDKAIGELNFNFQFSLDGGAYECTFAVPETLTVTVKEDPDEANDGFQYLGRAVIDGEDPIFYDLAFADVEESSITVTDLALSGEYGDVVTIDPSTNLLFIADPNSPVFLTGKISDKNVLIPIAKDGFDNNIKEISLSNLTSQDNVYAGTIADNGYYRISGEGGSRIFASADGSALKGGATIATPPIPDGQSILYIPDWYEFVDDEYSDDEYEPIKLTLTETDGSTKNIELTVVSDPELRITLTPDITSPKFGDTVTITAEVTSNTVGFDDTVTLTATDESGETETLEDNTYICTKTGSVTITATANEDGTTTEEITLNVTVDPIE